MVFNMIKPLFGFSVCISLYNTKLRVKVIFIGFVKILVHRIASIYHI